MTLQVSSPTGVSEAASGVTASGGSAQILEVNPRDKEREAEFRQLFDRTPNDEKLMPEISGARKEIGDLDRAASCARLARLRRDHEAIALQNFFPGTARDQTREALEDLARAGNAVLSLERRAQTVSHRLQVRVQFPVGDQIPLPKGHRERWPFPPRYASQNG